MAMNKKSLVALMDKLEMEYTAKITAAQASESILEEVGRDPAILEDLDLTDEETQFFIENDLMEAADDESDDAVDDDESDDAVDDDESDEDELPAPKKGKPSKKSKKSDEDEPKVKKTKAPKKEKTVKVKKISRGVCLLTIIKQLPKKGRMLDDVIEMADDMYVENGGPSNLKQTRHMFDVYLLPVTFFNIITVKEDLVKLVSE